MIEKVVSECYGAACAPLSDASSSDCGCQRTIRKSPSHASAPRCGCQGTTYRDLSDALELACGC